MHIAPRMAGLLVKVFAWLLESPILGGMLLYFLKKNNLIHKVIQFLDFLIDFFVSLFFRQSHHKNHKILVNPTSFKNSR